MQSLTAFITRRLKLKVNAMKSAVARPAERKFLGFSFTSDLQPKRRIAPKALQRFRERVRELTRRTRGVSLASRWWRNFPPTCEVGMATSASAKPPACCSTLISGRGADCDRCCGSSGSEGARGLRSFANGTSAWRWRPKPPIVPTALGGWLPRRLSRTPCPMPTSTRLAFPRWRLRIDSTRRTAGCGPARPVVWQGRAGNRAPYAASAPRLSPLTHRAPARGARGSAAISRRARVRARADISRCRDRCRGRHRRPASPHTGPPAPPR